MRHKQYLSCVGIILSCFFSYLLQAQDGENDNETFDFSEYETADVKSFCNNKINNLSPSNLLSISYDAVMPFDLESTLVETENLVISPMGINHGIRLETNYPVISKSSVLLNLYANYWQSTYTSSATFSQPNQALSQSLSTHPMRSSSIGGILFKPLNEKKFLLFQVESSLNGNYNFGDFKPNFSKMKYSAAALYGWKFNDYTNLAIGLTRTYRGGRLLHIPILMYNKTFNERWGTELLLPARGSMRYNFSVKSLLLFGYELEGQSYLMQTSSNEPLHSLSAENELELRKSEIRLRVQFRKSITDFIWLDAQAGIRIAYRFDLDENSEATEALLENNIGTPLYFRVGIALVSP